MDRGIQIGMNDSVDDVPRVSKRKVCPTFKIKFSLKLQDEADKKSLSDLKDAADEYVSPSNQEPHHKTIYDGVEACSNIRLGMEWMKNLCEQVRRSAHRVGTVGIYEIAINEAVGLCSLFFVGTIQTILQRLKKLDDNWV